jgi:3-oxoacyl-[acyl-carrier-protein] synthase-1
MQPLTIKACGLVTSVGYNAAASLAAIRAGLRNVQQTNLWDPQSGTYLAAGKVPLPQWWVGNGKLADLAAPAIFECFHAAKPIPASDIPVLLGIAPLDRPFRFPGLDTEILPEIEHRLGFRLHQASRVIPRDHVGVIVGLREAAELIRTRQAPCVIVAAVDSLLHHDLKNYYLSNRRLLTPANSNGFSLGEAGSAILVVPAQTGARTEFTVISTGLALEKAIIESETPLRAEGLVEAIHEALRQGGLTFQDLHFRITDANGEHYKFKEIALARMRFRKAPNPKLFDLWHPIECVGDVGAAIGPLVLGLALHASQKDYGIGPNVLCTFGNDNGERGALIATRQSGSSAS